jgi:hypothetical protein
MALGGFTPVLRAVCAVFTSLTAASAVVPAAWTTALGSLTAFANSAKSVRTGGESNGS